MFNLNNTNPTLLKLHIELDRINCYVLADIIESKSPSARTKVEHHLVHIPQLLGSPSGAGFHWRTCPSREYSGGSCDGNIGP